jgi:hypothetical protein
LDVLGNLGALVGNTPTAVALFTGWRANILNGGDFAYDGPFWEARNTIKFADKIVKNGLSPHAWNDSPDRGSDANKKSYER